MRKFRWDESKSNTYKGFPGGAVVTNPPAKQETGIQSLGWKDSLGKEMATHSSFLAWRIPWTREEPDGLQFMEFSRQENWNGLPFPSPGDLLYPGIKLGSPALQAESLLNSFHKDGSNFLIKFMNYRTQNDKSNF